MAHPCIDIRCGILKNGLGSKIKFWHMHHQQAIGDFYYNLGKIHESF